MATLIARDSRLDLIFKRFGLKINTWWSLHVGTKIILSHFYNPLLKVFNKLLVTMKGSLHL